MRVPLDVSLIHLILGGGSLRKQASESRCASEIKFSVSVVISLCERPGGCVGATFVIFAPWISGLDGVVLH